MANEIWHQEEKKYIKAIERVKIPNGNLNDVAYIKLNYLRLKAEGIKIG